MSEDSEKDSRRAPDDAVYLGGAAAVVSLLGLSVSLVLTLVKYRSDFYCSDSALSACNVGRAFDCGKVFSSAWSTFLGLPITAFATAFYGVALVTAGGLALGRRPFGGEERPLLFVLGVLDLSVSIAMATYAKVVLSTLCLYCMSLYLLSLLLFVCATGLSGRASLAVMRRALGLGWLRLRHAGPSARLGLISLLVLAPQIALYQRAGAHARQFADCITDVSGLPETDIKIQPPSPAWILAEFVDPACEQCLSTHDIVSGILADPTLRERLAIWVYLYPRTPRERCVPGDFGVFHKVSVDNMACDGALAVACAEQLQPGSGVSMLVKVLGLQRTPTPFFGEDKLTEQAAELGVDGGRMLDCVRNEPAAQQRVSSHVRFGASKSVAITGTPRLYFIPVRDGRPRLDRAHWFKGNKSRAVFEALIRSEPASVL